MPGLAVLDFVFPLMLPYLPTMRQLPSQKILSTSCSIQTVIFTRMPKGHTGTSPSSQSQTILLFSPIWTQHLSGRNVTLFSPTWTNITVCILSTSTFPSGAWLNAVPSSPTGTLLDDDTVRIATTLRLGFPVCQPHRSRCGTQIDKLGLHPLSKRLSLGRCPRHHALNDAIKRAIDTLCSKINQFWSLPVCREKMVSDRTVSPFSRSPAENVWSWIPPELTRLLPEIRSHPPFIPARLLLTQTGGSVLHMWGFLTPTTFNRRCLWARYSPLLKQSLSLSCWTSAWARRTTMANGAAVHCLTT